MTILCVSLRVQRPLGEAREWRFNFGRVSPRIVGLPTDSEVERKFIRKLEQRDDIKLYVKFPKGFKVRTPVGEYNPDWGIVFEERNQFGEFEQTLYLVRETKSTLKMEDLYQSQAQKIACGRKHFEELKVDFEVLTEAGDLKVKKKHE